MKRSSCVVSSIEELEQRRLLSVFVQNHVLHILGTEGDDTVKFLGHSTSQLRFSVNGEVFRFDRTQIYRISINSGDGNVSITIGDYNAIELTDICTTDGCYPDS